MYGLHLAPHTGVSKEKLMQSYFAPEDAELTLKFQPGGGRVDAQASQPFTIQYQSDGKAAAVSPADVKAIVEGPSRVVHQLRGAANKYSVFVKTSTPGQYTTTVTVRNRFVGKHSFYIHARTDAKKCFVTGNQRVSPGNYRVTIQLVDADGNPLGMGLGDTMGVSLLAIEGSAANLKTEDHGNGTFGCSLDLIGTGNRYELQFKINDEDMAAPWQFST